MSDQSSDETDGKPEAAAPARGSQKPKMKWLPVTALPHIVSQIDGLLAADNKNYQALQEARLRPGVLDRETVDRLIRAFTDQGRELGPCQEQLLRWRNSVQSDAQRDELKKLDQRLEQIRGVITSVLSLASEVKAATPRRASGSRSRAPILPFPRIDIFK